MEATAKLRARTEAIRNFIEREIDRGSEEVARLVTAEFGISRQAANRHLLRLEKEGLVKGEGKTRGRKYSLAVLERVEVRFPLEGLEEGEVWRTEFHEFMQKCPGQANIIANYAVTEMLNNAIDHSGGSTVWITGRRTARSIVFLIVDDGVGIFRKVASALELPNELQSVLELSKGKFTTAPVNHSGMGIFFSSRACDRMSIMSNPIMLMHSESGRDFVFEDKTLKGTGTHILLTIHLDTNCDLNAMFAEYASAGEYGFSKTVIPVALAEQGDDNLISRSQAKRVLARVERFKEVIFDFKGVESIGQAFADEIFRVFQLSNMDVKIRSANRSPAVERMIGLALGTLAEQAGRGVLEQVLAD